MADPREELTNSMVFFDPPPQSPYLNALVAAPGPRRAQTINIDNPNNRAEPYPARHVGIDAKEAEPLPATPSPFGVRMAQLKGQDSQALASSISGRVNTYRPRAEVAAERAARRLTGEIAPARTKRNTRKATPEPESSEPSPTSSTKKATRRRAAVAGEKKRKRTSQAQADDAEFLVRAEAAAEESEEEQKPVVKRRNVSKKRSVANSGP